MRVFWEDYPQNPACSELHADVKMPAVRAGNSKLIHSSEEIPENARPLVDALMAIPGIIGLRMGEGDPYSIVVERGRVFPWSEIRPRVEAILRDQFDAHSEIVDVSQRAADPLPFSEDPEIDPAVASDPADGGYRVQ